MRLCLYVWDLVSWIMVEVRTESAVGKSRYKEKREARQWAFLSEGPSGRHIHPTSPREIDRGIVIQETRL